jgi:hypothetical protein
MVSTASFDEDRDCVLLLRPSPPPGTAARGVIIAWKGMSKLVLSIAGMMICRHQFCLRAEVRHMS